MTPQFQTPLSLLRSGLDTMEIAEHLGCSESTAYNRIHIERQKEWYLPPPAAFPKPYKIIMQTVKKRGDL